jgi:hypothetical protein
MKNSETRHAHGKHGQSQVAVGFLFVRIMFLFFSKRRRKTAVAIRRKKAVVDGLPSEEKSLAMKPCWRVVIKRPTIHRGRDYT